ncbi:MAG: hypothetical protein NZ480_02045 [Bdellovibrionaceae bacterium]|nr:hypothetical protein [Pseudobdellovibrionaceae bacterium]MDW8190530.1 hypothetical protein [Pseudobdellovibrionaceae bacterium]
MKSKFVNRATLEIRLVQWLLLSPGNQKISAELTDVLLTDSRLSLKFKKTQKACSYLLELRSKLGLKELELSREALNYSGTNERLKPWQQVARQIPSVTVKFAPVVVVVAFTLTVFFFNFYERDIPQNETSVFVTLNKIKEEVSLSSVLSYFDIKETSKGGDGSLVAGNALESRAPLSNDEVENKKASDSFAVNSNKSNNSNSSNSSNAVRDPATHVSGNTQNMIQNTTVSPPLRSFVVRARLTLPQGEFDQEAFGNWLNQLNPERAGRVELGWKKAENICYYHFIFNQDKENMLHEYLKSLKGQLIWSKDPHPRLLPEGKSRIVLEIHLR